MQQPVKLLNINRQAGVRSYVKVSQNKHLMSLKQEFNIFGTWQKVSFDITVGPLVKLWEIGFDDAHVPDGFMKSNNSLTLYQLS